MESIWNDLEQAAWLNMIRALAQVHRRLAAEMEQQDGLPIAWYDVLVHLSFAPETGWSMQELADQVMMSGSGLTRMVDRLIDAGLVQRRRADERQADDRRVVRVALTEAGLATLAHVQPHHQARVRAYFLQHVRAEELECLRNVGKRVLAELNREEPANV